MPELHKAKKGKICNGVKIRKRWKKNPKTRVKKSRRRYNRKRSTRQLKKEIEEAE